MLIEIVQDSDIDPLAKQEITSLVEKLEVALKEAPVDTAMFALASCLAIGLVTYYGDEAEQILDTAVVESIRTTIQEYRRRRDKLNDIADNQSYDF